MLSNLTRKCRIVSKVRHCKTAREKAIGLMFSLPIRDRCLVFHFDPPRRVDLHMFFVFYPIDVLFLDRSRKVVEIKEHFLPFTVYLSRKKAAFVVELPNGTIPEKRIHIGDKMAF